jgi:hypothetical protein
MKLPTNLKFEEINSTVLELQESINTQQDDTAIKTGVYYFMGQRFT